MPRFFSIYDGVSLPDQDGTELADWREAQYQAIRLAGIVIADDAKKMKLGADWHMEVTDEIGLVLFRLDFHIASAAAILNSDDKENRSSQRGSTEV